MARKKEGLSRRERQIMDALYRLGKASAAEIREAIPDPPTYTAVRTHLGILQDKGHVRFESDGTRYIYEPVVSREEMGRVAATNVVDTFFGGSVERIVATLLEQKEGALTDDQLERLSAMIEQARREGR